MADILNQVPPAQPEPGSIIANPSQASAIDDLLDAEEETIGDYMSAYFRVLGHNEKKFYFLPTGAKQVVGFLGTELARWPALSQLAPRSVWRNSLIWDKDMNPEGVADLLIQECYRVGIFDPTKLRGRGGWIERDGSVVYHLGDRLMIGDKAVELSEYRPGPHIYGGRPALEVDLDTPLSDGEGQELLDLLGMLRWERPVSAILLGGWIAVAPVCGAMRWRPHIHINGPSGAGKTWIYENVLAPSLEGIAVPVLGSTSEAGIRQDLASDALPVIFDESEAENEKDTVRLQEIMQLARTASSDTKGKILKGTSSGTGQRYAIRSAFAFSSINVNVVSRADESRVTVLTLRGPTTRTEAEKLADEEAFANLEDRQAEIMTDNFAGRLLARSIALAGVMRESARIFARQAARVLGNRRDGDQIGTLLAGAWALTHGTVVTPEEARTFIAGHAWTEYVPDVEETDGMRLLTAILQAHTRERLDGQSELTIGELVEIASMPSSEDGRSAQAAKALARCGIRVEAEGLLIAQDADFLKRLLRETPWGVTYQRILLQLPGAYKHGRVLRFAGFNKRSIVVPHNAVA